MRKMNGKRIISSTLCALMIASLSLPTSIYGAEISMNYETRGVAQSDEYVIDDSSYNLNVYLLQNPDATKIKLANDNVTVSRNGETTVIPKQITEFVGWKPAAFGQREAEKMRSLGSGSGNQTLQFEKGSRITCRNITFEAGVHVFVPEETVVTFEDCVFKSGKIENNGTVYYRGVSEKPVNIGTTVEKPIIINPMEDESLQTGEIKYKKMLLLESNSFDEELRSLQGLYSGVKFGLLSGFSTDVGNTVVPKYIREIVGWYFGARGWGDYGATVRKIGEGKRKQNFTFEENGSTKISHLDFQSNVKVLIPANTNIHFYKTTFRGEVEVEQGGSATFEECEFLNSKEYEEGAIGGKGKVQYISMSKEPKKLNEVVEISYMKMERLTSNLKADIESCEDVYTGIKLGLIDGFSTNIGNTTLPKSIRDFVGWNFGKRGWGDYGAEVRKIGEGTTKQSFSFARGSDTKVRMFDFQENVDVIIPAYTTVSFENVTFRGNVIVEQEGVVEFKDCAFANSQEHENGIIQNNGESTYTGSTKEPVNTVNSSEDNPVVSSEVDTVNSDESVGTLEVEENIVEVDHIFNDNYQDLKIQLQTIKENITTIKIANGNITVCKANETVTIPKKIKKFIGWQEKSYISEEGEKLRTLGSGGKSQTFTFENNSKILVKNIRFVEGVEVIVPKTATVVFEDCVFDKTMTNNGTAVFNHCTFTSSQIVNNGAAEYTNQTSKPLNLGKENVSLGKFPLGMNIAVDKLKDGVVGSNYLEEIRYELSGTAKETAIVTAEVLEKESGLTAQVEEGKVKISGTPTKEMTVNVRVIAKVNGELPVEKLLELKTYAPFQVELAGTINSMFLEKTQEEPEEPMYARRLDAVSRATGGGGLSGGSTVLPDGSVLGQNMLVPYVISKNGTRTKWYEYSRDNKDATIETKVFPEGSGVSAECLFGSIRLSGAPKTKGEYFITVTVKDKGQEVTSNKVPFRIYTGNETLKEQLSLLNANESFWDLDPYIIKNSDKAIIPTTLKKIYGSHQSGTYGIIGNADLDKVDSDTLVIPSGCDLTLENIKIYSSVRIVVEKGGSLTLSDSVSYGKIEVNGGTFAMGNSSSLCDELILNDGSILQGKELKVMTSSGLVTKYGTQIKSHAHFATDGADKENLAKNVVVINGTVTVDGEVQIQGDVGSGRLKGQTALYVKGDLVIPKGSSVKALGGGAAPEDKTYMPAKYGGDGIVLENGRILGEGNLIAIGGISYDGKGGHGISGNGDIMIDTLESIGGDAFLFVPSSRVLGGDALQRDVAVMTKPENIKLVSGKAKKMDGTLIHGTKNGTDGKATVSKTSPTVHRPMKPPVNTVVEKPEEHSTENVVESTVEKPVVNEVEKPVVNEVEKPVVNEVEKPVVKPVETVSEKPTGNISVPTTSISTSVIPLLEPEKKKVENSVGTTAVTPSLNSEADNVKGKVEEKKVVGEIENKENNEIVEKKYKEENIGNKVVKKEKENKRKIRYYKKVTGETFVQVLKKLKVNSSFAFRKKIAEVNGIKGYTGTEEQNQKLLALVKKGKLKRPMESVNKKKKINKKIK